jgi:hypothetical protein
MHPSTKSTALLLSLSLFAVPACSKKKDKADTPPAAGKTVEAAAANNAEPAAPKVNAKLEALAGKFEGLEEQLEKLDYKTKAFEKQLVATYGSVTTTTKGEEPMKVWVQCDSTRCVGATITLDENPEDVYSFDRIDETKDEGYYHGFSYLAWRAANPDAKTSTTMTPKALSDLFDKFEGQDELLFSAALEQLKPAGKSVKYPDDDDYQYWHATDGKNCVAVGFMKYEDGEKGPEVDGLDLMEYEFSADPMDNDEYARCAMYALGL